MDSVKFTRLDDRSITESIRTLAEESSYFKSKIFKSLIVVHDLDPDVPRSYKRFVNDYVKIWEDYANDLASKIKSAKGTPGVHTVKYDYVKDYIYSKDDYASVLQFADGVIQGIKSEKFKEPEDIEDFFKYTVNKAFHDKGDSVAALLDSVLINGVTVDMTANTSKSDAKLFDSVKTYRMFNGTDSNELKKSIPKVVDFLTDEMGAIIRELKQRNTRMFVSMVNHIVEYISYSLASYACRVYIISQYAYPFIDTKHSDLALRPIDESAGTSTGELTPEIAEFDISVNIMHGANELMCRDYNQCRAYLETLGTFVKAMGADTLFGTNKPNPNFYMGKEMLTPDNAFISKLMGNALYEYLIMDESWLYMENNPYTEMNHVLKEYIYNNTQAYPGSYTPKQELLYVIRGAHYDNTIKGYKHLVRDMYLAAGVILSKLATGIHNMENWMDANFGAHGFNTAAINDISENIKMLKDLYTEIAVAFMHKGRDIELHFNNLKNAEMSKVENDLSLKIPYQQLDLSTNINMMNSVPNTTRVPYDILDLYDLPTFESLEMYDDYLRSLPGMADDDYLSEAVGISSIVNAIFSRIKSIRDRFFKFFKDKRFEANRKWVLDHANELLSLDFNGTTVNVLPYKVDIKLPEGYNNLIKNLNNFDEKSVETEEGIKAFIKSLYPNDTIYGWFYDTNADKSGLEKYRNYILFYDKLDDPNIGKIPDMKPISGATTHQFVSSWITTMRESQDLLNQLERLTNELNTSVNNVKSKLVSFENAKKQEKLEQEKNKANAENQQQNQQGQQNQNTNQSANNANGTASQTQQQPDANKGNTENGSTTEKVLLEISATISRLYGSLGDIFINYFITMGKYLKEAYSVGRKNSK